MTARHAPTASEWTDRARRRAARSPTSTPTRRRSDGVLEPAELVRQAAEAGVRLFAITDHDNLAGYRELTGAGADPLPDGLELVPGVEINAVTRGLDLADPGRRAARARARRGPGRRGVRGGARARSARPAGRASSRRCSGCATPGSASTRSSRRSTSTRDDALGRPTVARALIAAGLRRRASRTPSSGSWATGMPGLRRRAQGLGPVEAIRGDPGRGRAGIAGALPGGADPASLRDAGRRGPERPRDPPRVVRAPRRSRASARSRGSWACVGTGGTRLPRRLRAVRGEPRRARDARTRSRRSGGARR